MAVVTLTPCIYPKKFQARANDPITSNKGGLKRILISLGYRISMYDSSTTKASENRNQTMVAEPRVPDETFNAMASTAHMIAATLA
jgi:hypothetical protein